MTPAAPVVRELATVRRRSYDVRRLREVVETLIELSKMRHTGPVTIHFSQGGVRGLTAEERTDEPPRSRAKA